MQTYRVTYANGDPSDDLDDAGAIDAHMKAKLGPDALSIVDWDSYRVYASRAAYKAGQAPLATVGPAPPRNASHGHARATSAHAADGPTPAVAEVRGHKAHK